MKPNPFTICIPIRLDSIERLQNLKSAVSLYTSIPNARFIILEAAPTPMLPTNFMQENNNRISYIYIEDSNPVFHRTKYINQMLRQVTTSTAVVLDADIFMSIESLSAAIVSHERMGAILSLPYDGRCFYVNQHYTEIFHKYPSIKSLEFLKHNLTLMNGFKTVGGIYIVSVKRYIQIGMENEHFSGWGPEDAERIHRLEILGYSVNRWPGAIYHLYHPRLNNSKFYNDNLAFEGKREFCRICSMSRLQLLQYISTWSWIQ